MNEPARLLDAGATDLERQLLVAATAEPPSMAAAARTAAALGVQPLLAPQLAVAPTVAQVPHAAGRGVSWLKIAGWSLAGLVVAGAVATAVAPRAPSAQWHAKAPVAPVGAPASPQVEAVATRPRSVAPPVGVPPAPEESGVSTAGHAAKSSSGTNTGAAKGGIREEIALLDQARSALAGGDGKGALRHLATYSQRFPRGELSAEATLLRIEALAATGQRQAAESLARRYLATHPNSPHAKRLESLLGPQIR